MFRLVIRKCALCIVDWIVLLAAGHAPSSWLSNRDMYGPQWANKVTHRGVKSHGTCGNAIRRGSRWRILTRPCATAFLASWLVVLSWMLPILVAAAGTAELPGVFPCHRHRSC